ncbi:MAG: P22 coat - protein 5 family protein [Undibacterium sp.]|nr:P22 coat - protein 5 family protein [Opitutaceae bacterium]
MSRALFTLFSAALLAVLLIQFVPAAFAQAGAAGAAIAILAISALSAPLLSWSDGRLHANTLTALIPDVYKALDVVSRELVGLIPGVTRDVSVDQVALNQTVRSQATPVNSAARNITPAMAFPAAADQSIANVPITITNVKAFPFSWTGEEQKSINQGPGYLTIQQDQIAQAIRAAVNSIELDGANTARLAASRAYGTAGTTPFGTNLGESAQLKKILDDNGAPGTDRSLVINTTTGAQLRTLLNNPLNANTALAGDMTRQGMILDVNGFKFRESAQISTATKGTGTLYTSTAAGFAIGATSIPVITGAGTILAGDIITFAGDTNKYVVATGVAAPGTIVLAAPGLLQAIPAAATALTVGNNFVANLGFSRNALILAARLPAVPQEKDLAIMREVVTDPVSGLSLEVAVYPGYRMVVYEVGIAWGWKVIKPEHLAVLLG